jgi:hypothetical protein
MYYNLGTFSPGGQAASDRAMGMYDNGPGIQTDIYFQPFQKQPYGMEHEVSQDPFNATEYSKSRGGALGGKSGYPLDDPPRIGENTETGLGGLKEGFKIGDKEFKLKNPVMLFIILVLLAIFLDLWAQFGSKAIKRFFNSGEELSWKQGLAWAVLVSALLLLVIWLSGLSFTQIGDRSL